MTACAATTVEDLERELDAIIAKRHWASWGNAAAEREYVDRLKARIEAARQTLGQRR